MTLFRYKFNSEEMRNLEDTLLRCELKNYPWKGEQDYLEGRNYANTH